MPFPNEKTVKPIYQAAANDAYKPNHRRLFNSRQTSDRKIVGAYIGDILRAARSAADENLRYGPQKGVARCLLEIRRAADNAAWVCDYVREEAQQ